MTITSGRARWMVIVACGGLVTSVPHIADAFGGEPLGEPTPCDSAFVLTAEPAEQAKRDLDEASGRTYPLKPLAPTGDGEPVTLLDAGDQTDPVLLPIAAVEGNTAAFRSAQATQATIDPSVGRSQNVDFSLMWSGATTEMEVDSDGSHLQRIRIDESHGTNGFEEQNGFAATVLTGLTFAQSVLPDGRLDRIEFLDNGRASDDALVIAEGFLIVSPMAFPTTPIGIGATWTWDADVPFGMTTVALTYRYELTELDADHYAVAISWDVDVDVDQLGDHVVGTLAGTGTYTGSRDNALMYSLRDTQTRVWTIETGGDTLRLDAVDTYSMDSGTT